MNTQNENWLETRLVFVVYLRYFCMIVHVSIAATWQVSALHELGSWAKFAHEGSGYAMRWCKRIIEVL